MPSRWLRCLIVGFWLTTTGWLFWHDLWPAWRPGEPPPFTIDPVEEVHKIDPLKTYWTVYRREGAANSSAPVFSARTWVVCNSEDDSYTLVAHLDASKAPTWEPVYVGTVLKIDQMSSKYVVTKDGQLRSLRAEVKATAHYERMSKALSPLLGPLLKPATKENSHRLALVIEGEVRGDRFFARCQASLPSSAMPVEFDLPATAVSHTASVLMPLHPVNRIHGLRPGQHWRQPLIDPLRDSLAGLPGFPGGVRELQAHVLAQPQKLPLGNRELDCLVIEYTDDEGQRRARTWVEQDSERVQQQEADLDGTEWIMRREPLSQAAGPLPKRGDRKSREAP